MSYHEQITDNQARLIRVSDLFFVASADPELVDGPHDVGPVNISPKGSTKLHIIDQNHVAYLDFGGSGDETGRHARLGGPVTVMVCSFEEDEAAIVRLYGYGKILPVDDPSLSESFREEIGGELIMRPRQVIVVHVARTQTSCGYGLPVMKKIRERRKEDRGRNYWEHKDK